MTGADRHKTAYRRSREQVDAIPLGDALSDELGQWDALLVWKLTRYFSRIPFARRARPGKVSNGRRAVFIQGDKAETVRDQRPLKFDRVWTSLFTEQLMVRLCDSL